MDRRYTLLLVLLAMALGAILLEPRLALPISFDAKASYLPMARELLAKGWAYMGEEASVSYAPLAFGWPALLGAHEYVVRYANIALYCAAIGAAYLTLERTHGSFAAIAAAFLVAICPTVRPYIGDVMTEAPFIVLVAVWALAVARVAGGGHRAWIVAGGLALGLAVLVRPAAMYFAPLALAAFAWKREWRLASLHGIATLVVAAWVLRNAVVFGFPAVAAGAGGALYFGVNPLVDGFDPPYYGMNFDSGLAQDSSSHLSIHGDRTLRAIGTLELLDTPLSIVIPMFAHKALSFLFVSRHDIWDGGSIPWLRAWRIAMVALACIAFAANRRDRLVVTLAAFVAYMVAVHVPLLYTHRYSVGAIDYPLAVLAAVGIGVTVRSTGRIAAVLVALCVAVAAGVAGATPAVGSPMPDRIPTEIAWLASIDRVAVVGAHEPIDIPIAKDPATPPWDLSMVQLDIEVEPVPRSRCTTMLMRFRRAAEPGFAPWRVVRVPLEAGPGPHRYTVGSTVPLALDGAGTLRLELECTAVATARVGALAIVLPRRERHYTERYKARR